MKILAFAGSLRKGSHNARLLEVAVALARKHGADVNHQPFSAYDMPLYNEDVKNKAFPAGAELLRKHILEADGYILASPEYNYSIPGTVKNALDWISRYRPNPLHNKYGLLISASTGLAGGSRGLWALRVPLEGMGSHVFPEMFSLHQAEDAFEDAHLKSPLLQERLEVLIERYMTYVRAVKGALEAPKP